MSLVDVFITSPVKALVLVDTEVRGQDGLYREGSKMLALPHANVILAGRGHNAFLGAVFSIAHLIRGEFDALEQVMTEVLAQATAGLKPLKHLFFATSLHEQQIVLVGYSQARGRMHAAVFESKTEEIGFVKTDEEKAYLSPWTDSWGEPFQVSTPEHARFIAMMQVDNGLAMQPNAPLGGRLLMAEVTRDEMKVSTVCRLTEPRLARHAELNQPGA